MVISTEPTDSHMNSEDNQNLLSVRKDTFACNSLKVRIVAIYIKSKNIYYTIVITKIDHQYVLVKYFSMLLLYRKRSSYREVCKVGKRKTREYDNVMAE